MGMNRWKIKILLAACSLLCLPLQGHAQGRMCVLGKSGKAHLSVDLWGGALVDFRLDSHAVNPFSWNLSTGEMPMNNRAGAPFQGHFLCLGRWGAPTEGEVRAGIPHNGQPGNGWWQVVERPDSLSMCIRSEASLDGMVAERRMDFDAEHAVVRVTDRVRNTLATGRLFNVVQHATLGVPFLSASTIIDSNAKAGFMQHLSYPAPHAYEYMWPAGVLDTLHSPVDLRRSDTPVGYVTTHLFDDEVGWVTAASPQCGLLMGYVWNTAEYPWLNVWHDVRDGKPCAKGLEFGTTGIGRSYQDLLAVDTRFHGQLSFFFLDAGEVVEKSFLCFQVAIPADYRGVERVEVFDGRIVINEKETGGVLVVPCAFPHFL